MFNAFFQSTKSLSANPARTTLTTLGIVIGIATVILVLSAGEGFRGLINQQVEDFGTNTLFIETRVPPTTKNRSSGALTADLSRAGSTVAITSLKLRDLDRIIKLPNVVNGYGIVVGQGLASYRDTVKNLMYYGASAARFEIDKGALKSGRFYSAAEDQGGAQVVILGSNAANDFFKTEDPIGKLIKIGSLNFQVIGVYKPRGGFGGNEDDLVYLPLTTAQKKLMGIDYLVVLIIEMKDSSLGDQTAAAIRAELRKSHEITDPAKEDFSVMTQQQTMDTFNTIFNGITILLIAIAAISLIVGGVGIMNIMYVVVTERTAEIGLKKSLGAKSSDILSEFLVESVLVTLIGGVIGIGFGAALGWLVAFIAEASNLSWPFSVPLYAVALGFGVSAIIGISFGVLPARSAAKMDPIEALRYE